MSSPDVDVVVIGSGFGGSVAALRLVEKGYSVLVLEAYATTSWDVKKYLWAPELGCYGVQRIHKLPDVMILAGAGVGGGSLNYANTLYVPPKPFFEDQQWSGITDWEAELAPHYETASRMLGVVTNACDGPVERAMKATADDLGVGESFRHTPVGVYFGKPGESAPDPYFGGAGPARTGCTECGNCMVGCRVGAKNTLMKNYLYLAESLGAVIEPMRTVTRIGELPAADGESPAYRVLHERTGPRAGQDSRVVTAAHVVLAAGTWGTQLLLHAMKGEGELPGISERLGHLTRTNSESLLGAMTAQAPAEVDLTRGIAITTSFHPDAETHVENCRFGPGSNSMGLLSTLAVPGDTGRARPLEFLRQIVANPKPLLTMFPMAKRWSERIVIGLVMQTIDNSIIVSGVRGRSGRWKLTSRQGHGERGLRRATDGAFPGRLRDRRFARAWRCRRLPAFVGLSGHQCRGRLGDLGQPRGEPLALDHGPGRASLLDVAKPRRGGRAQGTGRGVCRVPPDRAAAPVTLRPTPATQRPATQRPPSLRRRANCATTRHTSRLGRSARGGYPIR